MSSPEGSSVTFRRAPGDVRPRAIARFARKLQREVAGNQPFDTLITGDAEMRKLNREFRRKDSVTDVLSFPSRVGLRPAHAPKARSARGAGQRPTLPSLGDIAISFPRARAHAQQFGHSVEQEIRILMLHGVLHLLGMDHETDIGRMARAERRWRTRLSLPNGMIERVNS